ncbi:hypothetical protein [Pseudomonas putida]|uniref:hypothetical protein n=1 Tax=Pseudomonas putida TaxID=303 RepID=UPI00226EFEA6|nr:hypothetical protein [Pseudomonas putida]MDD2147426.1 hypothetical protein [Pseudomonas putida]HDS1705764.1 hypothetical protein [Pseudomonas putida]
MFNIEGLGDLIVATGALGTASFALVDGSKAFRGGISNFGFTHIENAVKRFLSHSVASDPVSPLSLESVLDTLKASWLNGVPLADQRAIAKSLIKLSLSPSSAALFAKAAAVDAEILRQVASKIASGATESLTPEESDIYGRFDLLLTATLDHGYQRADQTYRNSAKACSIVLSVVLALIGVHAVYPVVQGEQYLLAFLLGLAATPIAPIAKDLTNALAAGAKVVQKMRK